MAAAIRDEALFHHSGVRGGRTAPGSRAGGRVAVFSARKDGGGWRDPWACEHGTVLMGLSLSTISIAFTQESIAGVFFVLQCDGDEFSEPRAP